MGVCHLQIKTFGRIYTENSLAGFMSNIPRLPSAGDLDHETAAGLGTHFVKRFH